MNAIETYRVNPVTKHETVDHSAAYPYIAGACDLHDFPGNQFAWHWHREIEIFYMRKGSLEYMLPGGKYIFEQGQGGFINSNVLHMTASRETDSCIQEEQQFLPEFIGGFAGSLIMTKYVLPVMETPGLEIVPLSPDEPAQAELLGIICRAYECYTEAKAGFELEVQRLMLELWLGLYRMNLSYSPRRNASDDLRIKQMIAYIASHYGEKLKLEQIAQAAYLSVRGCNRCFQERLGTTPFGYLMEYRVQKARELLLTTDTPISDIALQCGFGSSSYFGRIFLEKTGLTPRECRKAQK